MRIITNRITSKVRALLMITVGFTISFAFANSFSIFMYNTQLNSVHFIYRYRIMILLRYIFFCFRFSRRSICGRSIYIYTTYCCVCMWIYHCSSLTCCSAYDRLVCSIECWLEFACSQWNIFRLINCVQCIICIMGSIEWLCVCVYVLCCMHVNVMCLCALQFRSSTI